MALCKYKHVFGKEKQGVHSLRLFDVAAVDLILTILVGLFIAYTFRFNYFITILVLLLIGIISHRLFCVNSTINKMIFGIIKS
jgi:hypothetical protein